MSDKNITKLTEEQLSLLERLLSDLKYGTVTIIVQDGRVIQIDKNEKHRI